MITPAVLQAKGLSKLWPDGNRRIEICIEHLTLCPGDLKAMVGASGSGKSTALDMLGLVLRPDRFDTLSVSVPGRPAIDAANALNRRREEILTRLRREAYAYVVQTLELMPFLRIRQDFDLQRKISGRGSAELALQIAERLGISDCLDQYPARLSVGQRQRAAVVRALACKPAILLADEPTSALDPEMKDLVMQEFCRAAAEGSAVLLVTHDVDLVTRHGFVALQSETRRESRGWRTSFQDIRTT